ncbi:MAG: hypothetical protein Nk1A_8000 [Endomicrobiia bacterium]|nr:MAG: hypothetical protein Nk1A_8000 [Endomicrobiia bacterium]
MEIEFGYKNSDFEPPDGIKYKIANGLHVDKHFGDENASDIQRHTNESVKLFIESIPYYDTI